MGNMQDRLDKDVEGWRPEPGEQLIGTIVEVDTRGSDYGDDYPYLEVQSDDGEIKGVHAFHSVLKNEIVRKAPQVGQTIGIKYFGEVASKTPGNKPYQKYRVIIESNETQTPQPDWSSMQEGAQAEADAATGEKPAAKDEDKDF